MVLDELRVARLVNRKVNELLRHDQKVQKNLDILRSRFSMVKELVEGKARGFEASFFEPFPREGYAYSLGENFRDVSELKEWAMECLMGKVIVAVDGSQIGFDQHLTPKVAMIQTGYNVMIRRNASESGISYQGTFPKFYTPKDLTQVSDEGANTSSTAAIHYWRWEHEIKTAKCVIAKLRGQDAHCEECADEQDCPLSLEPIEKDVEIIMLIDGTLILSFLMPMIRKRFREIYIRNLEDLLLFCEKNDVAVAGYIVNSNAREVSKSLWTLAFKEETEDRELPRDTFLFNEHLKSFGDRTPFILSHRQILNEYEVYKDKIGFFYVRIDSQTPTRVEVPSFVYGWGRLNSLWRSIAAECVLGRGYPYTLARAHEIAVIRSEDRRRFYRILDHVLSAYGGGVRVSSKNRRKNIQII